MCSLSRSRVPLSPDLSRVFRDLTAVAASALGLIIARPSSAAWQPGGVPLSPMPATPYQDNSLRGLAADGSSGAYVVWQFEEPLPDFSGHQFALIAQRVDALGNRPAPWPAGGATIRTWLDNTGSGTYSMSVIGLYEDGGGGATMAALDNAFIVESLQLFRLYAIAPGATVAAIDIQNSTSGGYPVHAAGADGDGAGGAVMIGLQQTFASPPNPPPPSPLFAQRIGPAGATLWPLDPGTNGVRLNTDGDAEPSGVAALSDGAGGGFFAWTDHREPGDPDIYAQRLDATGTPLWGPGGVLVCGEADGQSDPHLARAGAGGVTVIWRDDRSGVGRLFGHVVLADGSLEPAIPADGRQLSSGDDAFVNLAADGQGGCFVVGEGSSGISRLYRFDPALLPRPGWSGDGIALNTLAPSAGAVGLAPDGIGGTFGSFRNGFGTAPPQGLYAQHIAADGTLAPGWGAGGDRLSGSGQQSSIVRSGNGAIAAWTDDRSPYSGVYAQRLVPDGPVAALLALASASASPRGVSLRWYSADGAALRAAVERNAGGAGWAYLADATADGTGYIDYEDAAVTPGERYGYRVSWQDGPATRVGGEVWVVVPRDLALELSAPSPNPSSGAVMLAVTLPDARGARLDAFDVAGRRVVARDLSALGAGRHVLALREALALAPGLYVVQLTQANATRRTRLVRVN